MRADWLGMGPEKDFSAAGARISGAKRGLGLADGFALIELLVAILIFSIVIGMATELFISNLRSTSRLQQQIQILDTSDTAKSWITSYLAAADYPPYSGDWQTLEVTSNGNCYQIALDTSTNELLGRSSSDCSTVSSQTPTVLAQGVQNTETHPLFIFKDGAGDPVPAASGHTDATVFPDVSQAKQVEVQMVLSNPSDSTIAPQTRTLVYTLGGVYLANQYGPNSIGSSQIVDGSVTNQKIAAGAINGSDFADGSVGIDKLTSGARASDVSFPIITGDGGTWSVSSTSSWDTGPNDAFTRVGVTLGDYCVEGKTLQARGSFVALNGTSSDLRLQFKLVRDDGQGGSSADYAIADAPTATNVPGSGYGYITTPWQTIDCSSPESTAYFYSPQARAGDSGSIGKHFSLVQAALELRYQ